MSRIYIGRLSYNAREKDVERFFRGFGRIRDINLKNGFGFVEFDDPRDADDAVYELNGRELLGERVIVEHSRGTSSGYGRRYGGRDSYDRGGRDRGRGYGPPTRTDYRILVENISSRVSWQDLKDFMRSAGEITFADAHKQRVGEGVVEYATYDDMKNAMKKLDGAELNGRKIKLIEDYRGSRKRSRSRSRSRNRSRSRSRSRDRRYRSGSRSRSRDRSVSRSRSRSKDKDNDRGRSHSRSKSPVTRDSRSKSKEVENNGEEHPQIDEEQTKDASPQPERSRSNSPDRDQSGSPKKDDQEMRSASASPARNDVDE